MSRNFAAVLALLAFGAGACGNDDGPLRDADDVRSEELAEAASEAAVGEQFELDGLDMEIVSLSPGGDESGAWLEAEIRAENSTDDDLSLPNVDLFCDGDLEGGGWQADSTFDMYADLPPKTFEEGVLNLVIPGQPRTGEPETECATPAYIEVSPTVSVGQPTVVRIPVPDDVIAQVQPTTGD
ncbi:MAG: hypothetical protein P1U38_11200 [Aeromicrobium sp.]|uniref:hypothetical protein n=1 Tax=Aeromicrobium sp. TaxID=1871063 RepID=UPI00262B8138|nr:hypothetical protein [Aeromicrobium sp.]MDF1705331.1 hypothetical protein [Aeromicrobium sp.]